jgi:hypothetical protein
MGVQGALLPAGSRAAPWPSETPPGEGPPEAFPCYLVTPSSPLMAVMTVWFLT